MHQNSTSAGAPPQTPRGPGVHSAPRPPSWYKGYLLLSEGEKYRNEKGRISRGRERTREEGKGMEGTRRMYLYIFLRIAYAIIGQS